MIVIQAKEREGFKRKKEKRETQKKGENTIFC